MNIEYWIEKRGCVPNGCHYIGCGFPGHNIFKPPAECFRHKAPPSITGGLIAIPNNGLRAWIRKELVWLGAAVSFIFSTIWISQNFKKRINSIWICGSCTNRYKNTTKNYLFKSRAAADQGSSSFAVLINILGYALNSSSLPLSHWK